MSNKFPIDINDSDYSEILHQAGYGSGVVNQLSIDLKNEFPDMGLSPRNLWNMKRFYERYYQAGTKLLQPVAVLLDKLEKGENENSSIGIILCADKDHLDVEIALQDINKPIGVAEYQLLLPKEELQALVLNELNTTNLEDA